jgi:hypothetical protein
MNKRRSVMAYNPQAQSEDATDESFPERYKSSRNVSISASLQRCVDDTSEFLDLSEHPSSRDPFRHQYRGANTFEVPIIGTDAERTHTYDQHTTVDVPVFDDWDSYDFPLPHDAEWYGEGVRNDFGDREEGKRDASRLLSSECFHNIPSHADSSYLVQSQRAATTSSIFSSAKNPPCRTGTTMWMPFQGTFDTSESARNFRKTALRFDRQPYRPPDSDPTIWQIESERERWTKSIYNAMIRPDAAKDNPKSNAMRRWVEEPFYDSLLVEAYAHRILDALLDQAKIGFRGWKHDDYTQDERKGEIEDTQVSCEERLRNVIKALEEEKTICEDVMASSCQIRMFVNAPKAYAGRKLNNRVGNSKRKRARDPRANKSAGLEEISRPAKSRRPDPRSSARKTQPSIPGADISPRVGKRSITTPQPTFRKRNLASHHSTAPQGLILGPTLSYNAPNAPQTFPSSERHTSTTVSSLRHQLHVAAMSPPQPHVEHIDILHPPYMSHSSPAHSSASVPITPEQPQTVKTPDYSWQQSATFGYAPDSTLFDTDAVDPSLFPKTWDWSKVKPSCSLPEQDQIQFDPQLFSTASLGPSEGSNLQYMWGTLSGVQGVLDDSATQLDGGLSSQ